MEGEKKEWNVGGEGKTLRRRTQIPISSILRSKRLISTIVRFAMIFFCNSCEVHLKAQSNERVGGKEGNGSRCLLLAENTWR